MDLVYVVIFAWAILEMAFLPVPTEIFIIPLVVSRPVDPLTVAVVGALGSTVGGLVDYAIGKEAFDFVDSRFDITNRVTRFQKRFRIIAKYGLPGLLAFGRAIPLGTTKPLMFLAGATRYDLRMFCVLVAGSSFIRYADAATFGAIFTYIRQSIKFGGSNPSPSANSLLLCLPVVS